MENWDEMEVWFSAFREDVKLYVPRAMWDAAGKPTTIEIHGKLLPDANGCNRP